MTLRELQKSPDWKCLEFLGFPNNWICRDGRAITTNSYGQGKIAFLRPSLNTWGYTVYNLWYNKKGGSYLAHKLVALAFIPNPYNLPEVNHKDRNKSNCNDWNLEWISRYDNNQHMLKTQRLRKECKHG